MYKGGYAGGGVKFGAGGGTANYLQKSNGTSLVNSLIQDDGSKIGINTAPDAAVQLKVDAGSGRGMQIRTSSISGSHYVFALYANGISYNPFNVFANSASEFKSSVVTVVPLTIKGAAGQTANLQEWNINGGAAVASVTPTGSLMSAEKAAADADVAGYGQLWVKNTTPCQLWFTDDAGTDTQIV